jgi:hypothetical protein
MKPTDIYFLLGQFSRISSGGMIQMAETVSKWPNVNAKTFLEDEWGQMVSDVNAHASEDRYRFACGYSLGANALTWVLGGVDYQGARMEGIKGCTFEACAFLDPTWMSVMSPLSKNKVKHIVHYHNNSLDPWGHAQLVLGVEPPTVQVIEVYLSHFMVDFDRDIQNSIYGMFRDA